MLKINKLARVVFITSTTFALIACDGGAGDSISQEDNTTDTTNTVQGGGGDHDTKGGCKAVSITNEDVPCRDLDGQ